MRTAVFEEASWRDPAEVLSALGERPWTIAFLTGGAELGWSYVAADPAAVCVLEPDDPRDPLKYGLAAYKVGINVVIYAMTH